MNERTLLSLPSELLTSIFGYTDSFRTVTNLALTSRTLHEIWTQNSYAIADHIQRSVILCYVDARALAEAQEVVSATHVEPSVNKDACHNTKSNDGDVTTDPARHCFTSIQIRILQNAAIVREACQTFLDDVVSVDMRRGYSHPEPENPTNVGALAHTVRPFRDPPFLTIKEEARFMRALYRTWTYLTWATTMHTKDKYISYVRGKNENDENLGAKRQQDMLKALTDPPGGGTQERVIGLEEHWRLCEAAWFLMVDCDSESSRFFVFLCWRRACYGQFHGRSYPERINYKLIISSLLALLREKIHSASGARPQYRSNACLGDIFESYRHLLLALGHSGIIPRHQGCPKEFYMAVFDDHQQGLRTMAQDIVEGRRKD